MEKTNCKIDTNFVVATQDIEKFLDNMKLNSSETVISEQSSNRENQTVLEKKKNTRRMRNRNKNKNKILSE